MIPIGNAARRAENFKSRGRKDPTRTRSRPKQSRLPKKPKFEFTKSTPGKFPVEFKKASDLPRRSRS